MNLFSRSVMRLVLVAAPLLLPAGAAHADKVLDLYTETLTSYKAAATLVQKVSPLPEQRGVFIDGTLQAPPALDWALAADPFGQAPWNENASILGSVRAQLGTYQISDVDIALPAPGLSWVVGRSYNPRQKDSNGAFDSTGPQGKNWFQSSQPELVLYEHPSDDAKDVVYLVYGADRYAEFHRTGSTSTEYKAVNGAAGVIQFAVDTSGPDLWKYTDQHGSLTIFFGFDAGTTAAKRGQLWKIEDPAGNTAYVGHVSNKNTALSSGYDASGRIIAAYDPAGRKYVYDYSSGRLDFVKVQGNSGSWVDTGQRVDYTYYGGGDSNGNSGDLKTVKVTAPVAGGAQFLVTTSYYRYYTSGSKALKMVVGPEGTRNFDWNLADDHLFDDDFLTATDDNLKPYAAAFFASYDASNRITELWLNGECGCSGGVSGTYRFVYTNSSSYGTYVGNTSYDNGWATKTLIKYPGAHADDTEINYFAPLQYFDETGQPLSRVEAEFDFDETGAHPYDYGYLTGGPWCTKVERDASGLIEWTHTPEAITSYNSGSDSFSMEASAGLVRHWVRESGDVDLKGFIRHYKYRVGTSATENLERTFEYSSRSKTVGAVSVVRPVVASSWVYSLKTTTAASGGTGPTGAYETTHTYAWWTGSATLMIKQDTTRLPAVGTGNNGGNTYAYDRDYYRTDGTIAFRQASDGSYEYSQFTDGLVTETIDDAKIDDATAYGAGDDPNGIWGIDETGAKGLHVVTQYALDDQGRPETVTSRPGKSNEQREVYHYTYLKDRRPVTIACPRYDWTNTKYHGPVEYTVLNQAGNADFVATVALNAAGESSAPSTWVSSTNTNADPIASLLVGSVTRLKASLHDASGNRVGEDRTYVSIPGSWGTSWASGGGTAGTEYEHMQYGYDDRGRRDKIVDLKGSLVRMRFDARGDKPTQSYSGTSDGGFNGGGGLDRDLIWDRVFVYSRNSTGPGSGGAGGSGSGSGSAASSGDGSGYGSTMCYMPNQVGNRPFPRSHGQCPGDGPFVVDGHCVYLDFDGDYDTDVTRDYRGNVVRRRNGATAPHVLAKYDNIDRVIAIGLYGSAASIGSDAPYDPSFSYDPTSLQTDRVALLEYAYDERGRMWKTTRHNIDGSDGSDDDSIATFYWYDDGDRVIKVDGPELKKVQYDGLGRATREFILASVDDTTYAHAADVNLSGDIVLQERRLVYDTGTTNVVMEAAIDRRQNDYGAGQNTGWLDKNVDGDDLKFTGTDLKGRIQIRAKWFDAWQRLADVVEYGTYKLDEAGGPSAFNRSGLSVPTRSSEALRTTYTYDTSGDVLEVADARNKKTRCAYDAAGRITAIIRNYVDGTAGGSPTATDDQYTWFVYGDTRQDDGETRWIDEIRVDRDGDGVGGVKGSPDSDDAITKYVYGVSTSDADFPSRHANSKSLLYKVLYPDSGGASDAVFFAYEAHHKPWRIKDQGGTVWEYTRDYNTGREIKREVITYGSGLDTALNRIETAYDPLGRVQAVTQYINVVGSPAAVDNEVKFSYDGWGNVTKFQQDKDSAVGTGDSYDVSYAYSVQKNVGGRETIRRTSMTVPGASGDLSVTESYIYSSTGGLHDDAASRVSDVKVSVTTVAKYQYLGIDHVVGTDYPQPQVFRHNYGAAAGTYPNLDIFNRTIKDTWTKDLATDKNFVETNVSYDENSNVTLVDDLVYASVFDVQYSVDDLDRLTEAKRGNWNGSTINTLKEDEQWALTQQGDADLHKLDLNGNGSFTDYASGDLQDKGTFNKVSELTNRDTNNDGSPEYPSIAYNAIGELIDDKEKYKYKHTDGVGDHYAYDALGRLLWVRSQSDALVAEYRYNGLGYRIGMHFDVTRSGGGAPDGAVDTNDPWYFFVYDEQWRLVGTVRGAWNGTSWGSDTFDPPGPQSSAVALKEMFVPHNAGLSGLGGASAVDELACRRRDNTSGWSSGSDGTLEELRYLCQDWHWNIVAVLTDAGAQVEQVRYSGGGMPATFPAGDADEDHDWDVTDNIAIALGGSWSALKDVNLDGTISSSDVTAANNVTGGYQTLGRGIESSSAVGNRRGYAGYEWDVSTGTFHVRHRVYAPALRRWITRDPIGYGGGSFNMYQYVNERPLVAVDPSGLDPQGWPSDFVPSPERLRRDFDPRRRYYPEPIRFETLDNQKLLMQGVHNGQIATALGALRCCETYSRPEVQFTGHSCGAGVPGFCSLFQLQKIRQCRERGEPLPKPLQEVDELLRETRRVAPNLDVFACGVFGGEDGEQFRQLLKSMYGFDNVRGATGTCGNLGPFEFRLPFNLPKKTWDWWAPYFD